MYYLEARVEVQSLPAVQVLGIQLYLESQTVHTRSRLLRRLRDAHSGVRRRLRLCAGVRRGWRGGARCNVCRRHLWSAGLKVERIRLADRRCTNRKAACMREERMLGGGWG